MSNCGPFDTDVDEAPLQVDDVGEVDNALEMATDILGSKALCQSEDLEEARDTVRNNVHNAAQFKKDNPSVKCVEVCLIFFPHLTMT